MILQCQNCEHMPENEYSVVPTGEDNVCPECSFEETLKPVTEYPGVIRCYAGDVNCDTVIFEEGFSAPIGDDKRQAFFDDLKALLVKHNAD